MASATPAHSFDLTSGCKGHEHGNSTVTTPKEETLTPALCRLACFKTERKRNVSVQRRWARKALRFERGSRGISPQGSGDGVENDARGMVSLDLRGCGELDGPRIRLAWSPKNNMRCLMEEIRVSGCGYGTWNPSGSCWWWWWWCAHGVGPLVLVVWWLMSGVEAPIRTKQRQARGRRTCDPEHRGWEPDLNRRSLLSNWHDRLHFVL